MKIKKAYNVNGLFEAFKKLEISLRHETGPTYQFIDIAKMKTPFKNPNNLHVARQVRLGATFDSVGDLMVEFNHRRG